MLMQRKQPVSAVISAATTKNFSPAAIARAPGSSPGSDENMALVGASAAVGVAAPPRILFLSRGSDPLTHPRVGSFKAVRVFDPTIRGFHVTLDAGLRSNACLEVAVAPAPGNLCAHAGGDASPPHPLLLFQLRLPAGPAPGVDASLTHLTITLGLASGEEVRFPRRIALSTAYRAPAVTALHAQLPLAGRLLGTAAPASLCGAQGGCSWWWIGRALRRRRGPLAKAAARARCGWAACSCAAQRTFAR